MRAFILAGGFATRLWPLTEKRAKPLLPLAGKPILTHIAEKIPRGIPITVSTNAVFREGFKAWEKELGRKEVEILIEDATHDDHKPGALGAVAQWIRQTSVNDDILLLTGDNYFGFSLEAFLTDAQGTIPAIAAHDIGDRETAKSFGTVILKADGKTVQAFEEKPLRPQSTLVSTGCSLLPARTLPILTEFAKEHPDNVGGIFEEFLRRGAEVRCSIFSDHWFDIGSFDAYLKATRALVGDKVMSEGSTDKESDMRGSVVIGPKSAVRKSTLRNVVLFEECEVEDCILTDCILDNHCVLKGVDLEGKMLREGTKLIRSA